VFDELSLGLVHEAAEKIAVNKTKIKIALIRSPLSGIVIGGKGRLCRLANRERYLKVKVDFWATQLTIHTIRALKPLSLSDHMVS
jgi:hypothetical protein